MEDDDEIHAHEEMDLAEEAGDEEVEDESEEQLVINDFHGNAMSPDAESLPVSGATTRKTKWWTSSERVRRRHASCVPTAAMTGARRPSRTSSTPSHA